MSDGAINLYGDTLVETTGSHGADIAGQRLDDLDRAALQAVLALAPTRPSCIEFGCGHGWQGARFALLGATVAMVDLLPPSRLVQALLAEPGLDLAYAEADLRELVAADLPAAIDVAFSQRTLHYLRYAEAHRLMALAASRMAPGATCFVSVSGLGSELGQGYGDHDRPVESRHAVLAVSMRERHGIHEAVCLYAPDDLSALMEGCGFATERLWTSPFGNVKGIFARSA